MHQRTKHELKIALIVDKAPLLDLANNYCELMKEQTFECNIFQTIEGARNWVNN